MSARWASAVALAAALGGCGARVDIATEGGGGTSSTSSTASSSAGCPAAQPASGAACSPEGLACHYDAQCGGADATCTKGAWWVQEYGLGCAAVCPTTAPNAGDPCSPCCLPPSCTFANAEGCAMVGTCPNDVWVLSEPTCPPSSPCAAHGDWTSCGQDPACRWLTPGCTGGPPMFEDGCYPAKPCFSDFDCGPYQSCKQITYDPCYMKGCNSCSAPSTLCL
jgi:hypothetical protein